jgi:hypothetical protein
MCIKIWHERVDVAEAEEKPTGQANFGTGPLPRLKIARLSPSRCRTH